MATQTINYSANTTITMDLSGLASSSTFLAGRESTQIDNTSNKYVDALVRGYVSTGTGPTANTSILVYVYGSDDSLATVPIDVLDGTDSAETISNSGVLSSSLKLAAMITNQTTGNNFQHTCAPFSVAALFGGVMPKYWGLYIAHNTGAALYSNAVNTDSFRFVGIKYDVA